MKSNRSHVRLADSSDEPKFSEWLRNTPLNLFTDFGLTAYPRLTTFAVERNSEPVLYLPSHPVRIIESIAHKPDITPLENARAIKAAHDAIETLAQAEGEAEIMWLCADESLIKFAQKHGYEVIKTTVLRKKV